MSKSPPTYFKQLNTFAYASSLSWALSIGYVGALLHRRFHSAGLLADAVFALSLLSAEFAFYCLTIIIYRIWFHPLAKHPGPFLAKFTDWYSVYHCAIGDRHIDFYKLHCKYGKPMLNHLKCIARVDKDQDPLFDTARTALL